MYFRRALLVLAALASPGLVEANHSKSFGVDIRRQRRFANPKTAVIPTKTSILTTTTTSRGGALDSQKASIILGLVLALNSGFINGCCLSGAVTAGGAKQAVAAVTASWTNSALGAAGGNSDQFVYLSKVILAFMSGSTIAGFLNPKPALFTVSTSVYALPLAIGAALLVAASKLVQSSDSVKTGFLLCAVANGIQNSVTSTLTGNLCRSSHYSGITSDMGTFLGQILAGNKTNVFKLKVFMGLSACFWLGGYLSFGIGKELGANSLLVAAGLYALIIAFYESIAKNI